MNVWYLKAEATLIHNKQFSTFSRIAISIAMIIISRFLQLICIPGYLVLSLHSILILQTAV